MIGFVVIDAVRQSPVLWKFSGQVWVTCVKFAMVSACRLSTAALEPSPSGRSPWFL
jgi:hypothetical protein